MVIICDMSEALMIYPDHILNFKVLCTGILKLSSLKHYISTQSQTSAVTHYTRL